MSSNWIYIYSNGKQSFFLKKNSENRLFFIKWGPKFPTVVVRAEPTAAVKIIIKFAAFLHMLDKGKIYENRHFNKKWGLKYPTLVVRPEHTSLFSNLQLFQKLLESMRRPFVCLTKRQKYDNRNFNKKWGQESITLLARAEHTSSSSDISMPSSFACLTKGQWPVKIAILRCMAIRL